MRVVEVSKDNKFGAFVICLGDDITNSFSAKKILIKNKEFDVLKYNITNSISNNLMIGLQLNERNPKKIPLGEVTIIE